MNWKVAFALLGSALAWLGHLLITYGIGEFSCVQSGELFQFLHLNLRAWLLIIATTLALGASIASTLSSRRLKMNANETIAFCGYFGFFAGILFTLSILAQLFPIFTLLNRC